MYEYLVKVVETYGVTAEKLAKRLTEVINEQAGQGWEFDSFTSRDRTDGDFVIFRRKK